jgi:hypothetical protein
MRMQTSGGQSLGDQIKSQVRDQIASTQEQARAAQQQTGTQVAPRAPNAPIEITRDGRTIVIPSNAFPQNFDLPRRAADVTFAFFFTVAIIAIGLPIARALGRWLDRRPTAPQIPSQVTAQLNQLTQAVDAIAIEVERISEGQRFTTKLLSEQAKKLPPG